MSILIKGMKMPKDKDVILRIDSKGEVYIYGGYPTEIHEAVELPDHGDLIERDELMKYEVYIPRDCGNLPVVYMSYVKAAKTVIPAERS